MLFITQTNQLKNFIKDISSSDFVAVDTEFLRETTYWPKLCLIQLATPEIFALIDPLAEDLDLAPFFELMVNEKITKVFHCAFQDIEIIYHLSKILPNPIFDTQIAAMAIGYKESIAYEQLVNNIVHEKLNKSMQRTNWSNRPLTAEQCDYASKDVIYLCDIYLHLKKQLAETGRLNWINEEHDNLQNIKNYISPPEEAWKRLKLRSHKAKDLFALKKLAAWRESTAQKKNLARSHVIRDALLIEIALKRPKNKKDLSKLKNFSSKLEDSTIERILEIVKQCDIPSNEIHADIERAEDLPENASMTLGLLKIILKLTAQENNICPKILASNEDLENLLKMNGSAVSFMDPSNWRYDIFGKKVLDFLNGELGFCIKDHKIKLITAL